LRRVAPRLLPGIVVPGSCTAYFAQYQLQGINVSNFETFAAVTNYLEQCGNMRQP